MNLLSNPPLKARSQRSWASDSGRKNVRSSSASPFWLITHNRKCHRNLIRTSKRQGYQHTKQLNCSKSLASIETVKGLLVPQHHLKDRSSSWWSSLCRCLPANRFSNRPLKAYKTTLTERDTARVFKQSLMLKRSRWWLWLRWNWNSETSSKKYSARRHRLRSLKKRHYP